MEDFLNYPNLQEYRLNVRIIVIHNKTHHLHYQNLSPKVKENRAKGRD